MYKVSIVNSQRDSGESNANNQIPRHLVTIYDSLSGDVLVQHYTKADPFVASETDGVTIYNSTETLESNLIDIQIDNIALFSSRVFCRVEYVSMDGLPNEDLENGQFGIVQVNATKTIYEGERFILRNVPYRYRWNLLVETYNYDSDNTVNDNILGVRGVNLIEGITNVNGVAVAYGSEMYEKIELFRLSDALAKVQLPNSPTWLDDDIRPTVYYLPPTEIPNPPPPPPPTPPPVPPVIISEPIIPDSPTPFAITDDYVRQLTPYYKRVPKFLAMLRSLFVPIMTQINDWSVFEQELVRMVYQNGSVWSLQFYLNRNLEFAQGTITIQNQTNGGFKIVVPPQLTEQQRDTIRKYVDRHKISGVAYLIQNSV